MLDLSTLKNGEDYLGEHHYQIKEFHEINMNCFILIICFEAAAINNKDVIQKWKIEPKHIEICHVFYYFLCFFRHYIDHASNDNEIQKLVIVRIFDDNISDEKFI